MAQGIALSANQIETIRATWLLTRNGSHAARLAGCNVATANRYIKAHREELTQLAHEKKPELTDVLRAVLDQLLSSAVDTRKLSGASLSQVMQGVGITIDKLQLLSGQPTARTETSAVDPTKLTPEEREQAAKLRAKLAAEVSA